MKYLHNKVTQHVPLSCTKETNKPFFHFFCLSLNIYLRQFPTANKMTSHIFLDHIARIPHFSNRRIRCEKQDGDENCNKNKNDEKWRNALIQQISLPDFDHVNVRSSLRKVRNSPIVYFILDIQYLIFRRQTYIVSWKRGGNMWYICFSFVEYKMYY